MFRVYLRRIKYTSLLLPYWSLLVENRAGHLRMCFNKVFVKHVAFREEALIIGYFEIFKTVYYIGG